MAAQEKENFVVVVGVKAVHSILSFDHLKRMRFFHCPQWSCMEACIDTKKISCVTYNHFKRRWIKGSFKNDVTQIWTISNPTPTTWYCCYCFKIIYTSISTYCGRKPYSKDPIRKAFTVALTAKSCFQSKQRQLQCVAVTAR